MATRSPKRVVLAALLGLVTGGARADAAFGPSAAASPAGARSEAAARGFAIMADRRGGNCIACHAVPGVDGAHGNFGPALDGVGSRHDRATLRQWVTDARRIHPETMMPPFGTLDGIRDPIADRPILTAAQIDDVAAALETLK